LLLPKFGLALFAKWQSACDLALPVPARFQRWHPGPHVPPHAVTWEVVHDSPVQRRARAVGAASAVGRSYGLDVGDPLVLADSNNTIVHVRPAPVVAKVGTTGIQHGPAVLDREPAVAKRGRTRRSDPGSHRNQ
jgi:hypothetical protein